MAQEMPRGSTDFTSELTRVREWGAEYILFQNTSGPVSVVLKNAARLSMTILCLLFIHPPAHGSEVSPAARNTLDSARIPRASKLLICGLFQKVRVLAQDGVWEQTFGATPPRSRSRVFLLRVLLHEHQCRTYGGHSVANRRVLAAMANGTPGLTARTGSVSAGRPETNQVRCARMNK